MNNNAKSFDEWFDSLSEQEQREYVEDMEADYWINFNKSNPPE